VAFCIYLDYWFYDELVLTPYNYFFANIVENRAAGWGTSPWWYYIIQFFLQSVPPISLLLFLFFCIGLHKKRAHVFTWCLVPFLLAHFVVAHKEMRFMFPMLLPFIYLAAMGVDWFFVNRRYNKALRFSICFCSKPLICPCCL
jgi:phosphatidylinositol glycan class B